MIPRYKNEAVENIFSDAAKIKRWDQVELAVIRARVQLGHTPEATYWQIEGVLRVEDFNFPAWWELEKELNHDLAAYVQLRQECLPAELQHEFHRDMTSYDTEDPAFALALLAANGIVSHGIRKLTKALGDVAQQYRYTPMLARTHGQGAKLCSFGGEVLTWLAELRLARNAFEHAHVVCMQSRLSGAIGNYGAGLSPELEEKALGILGLTPYYGATQIMSRVAYAQLAQSLELVAQTLGKVSLDLWLGARSGLPLWQESFGKANKGSSAMPHKRNPIRDEQMTGMVRMASGRVSAIVKNIETRERRAIEQSCVERVEWPDLYHVVVHMLTVMEKVLRGLAVYPDHMLQKIAGSRGTYASDEAKNFLAEQFAKRGVEANVAYRIIQLASWNAFRTTPFWAQVRENPPDSIEAVSALLAAMQEQPLPPLTSIREIVASATLVFDSRLEATAETMAKWNALLSEIFSSQEVRADWEKLFTPAYLLNGENHLFDTLLGEERGV